MPETTRLPSAAKRQSEEAQRIITERSGGDAGSDAPPAKPAEPENEKQTVQPEGDPPAGGETPKPEEQPADPGPEPGSLEERAKKAEEDVEYWRSRFNTLQGKYNAEVPRLSEKVKTLEQRLEQPQQQAPAGESGQGVDPATVLSQDELDELGPRMAQILVNTADRLAERRANQSVEPLRKDQQKRDETEEERQDRLFFDRLAELAPDWSRVNDDPDFEIWLNENAHQGKTFKQLINDARYYRNADDAASFFNGFVKAKGKAPEAQATEPATDDGPGPSQRERQVQPNASRGNAPPTTGSDDRVWTEGDIQKFYSDVRQGLYKGKDDQKVAIEQDIFAAYKEGRVRR